LEYLPVLFEVVPSDFNVAVELSLLDYYDYAIMLQKELMFSLFEGEQLFRCYSSYFSCAGIILNRGDVQSKGRTFRGSLPSSASSRERILCDSAESNVMILLEYFSA